MLLINEDLVQFSHLIDVCSHALHFLAFGFAGFLSWDLKTLKINGKYKNVTVSVSGSKPVNYGVRAAG
jgi:hypothetical protein